MTTLDLPKTVAEAVEMLHGNMSLNDEVMLANMNEEDLIDVHFALGYHTETSSASGRETNLYLNLAGQ